MPPFVMRIHSPHVPWHQEETTAPRGVHCPEACLVSLGQRLCNLRVPQAHHSRMLHLLACLPLLSQSRRAGKHNLACEVWGRCVCVCGGERSGGGRGV